MTDLESLRNQLRAFAAERDWDQFHSPKNLAAALTVEAAEPLEHFQWLTEAETKQLPAQSSAPAGTATARCADGWRIHRPFRPYGVWSLGVESIHGDQDEPPI